MLSPDMDAAVTVGDQFFKITKYDYGADLGLMERPCCIKS